MDSIVLILIVVIICETGGVRKYNIQQFKPSLVFAPAMFLVIGVASFLYLRI